MTTVTATTTTATTATVTSGYITVHLCPRCGGGHVLMGCPQVRAIEYHDNGQIKRIEFSNHGDYWQPVPRGRNGPYEITVSSSRCGQ